jgi:hypothetical protein
MKIVIINGAAESGKDKFIKYIEDNARNIKVVNLSSIDPSKEALIELGWDGKTKNEETRQAMVDLKQMSIRLFNGPYKYIIHMVKRTMDRSPNVNWVFFIHVREPEEIQKLVVNYNIHCLTLLIRSPRGKALKNGADDVVENFPYDHIIENDGTLKTLKSKAIEFAKNHLI